MSPECFYFLLNLIEHKLVKRSMRQTISPEHRLVITLFYLAQGYNMQVVAWSFLIGKTTVSVIVRETCAAIWEVLSPIYLKTPTTEDLLNKSKRFYEQWNLPNCCGAIDGKHIVIQAPNKSGSAYFNYKKTFSIILMAVCDADYIFTFVDIGAFGSQSDGGVFKESTFGQALESGTIKLPADSPLPNTNSMFPYYFVGDEAFPLKSYILRPYPGKNLDVQKRIFNYRLSRARRTIENAFGILSSRWRILRNNIIANVETVEKIVAATVCLHNFLRIFEQEVPAHERVYCPSSFIDNVHSDGSITPGLFRNDRPNSFQRIGRLGSNNASRNMIELRDKMTNYLANEGAVPWQWNHILRGYNPE
ncbi:PREDICTED: putative nuclease HARBI1 [Vollenhovia emeryi]|uniref:putative nuclease HARBI1 n=1 Tax=Vollenhovia emeryi TaxID=411798 RepID=UPI0005F40815|nr:PREDICTED: putative nuclease HARBI1 [Vollenhovia emeryi]